MKYPDGIMLERGQYTVLLHGKNVDSFSYALEDKSDCGSEMCLLAAGGGMSVEVFNRGVIPLAYNIIKKNKVRETSTYLDGMFMSLYDSTKVLGLRYVYP
ncbi:hypothetical protein YC2023_012133 [Brassica napus]